MPQKKMTRRERTELNQQGIRYHEKMVKECLEQAMFHNNAARRLSRYIKHDTREKREYNEDYKSIVQLTPNDRTIMINGYDSAEDEEDTAPYVSPPTTPRGRSPTIEYRPIVSEEESVQDTEEVPELIRPICDRCEWSLIPEDNSGCGYPCCIRGCPHMICCKYCVVQAPFEDQKICLDCRNK
jgi:hypothetical protein